MLLWLVQLVGYPVLIWLVWIWFGIAERSMFDLLSSLLLGIAIIAGLSWLLASAFHGSLDVRRKLPRAAAFSLALLVLAGLNFVPRVPRRSALLWTAALLVTGALIPALLLGTPRLLRKLRYWAAWGALNVVGCGIPYLLINWVPEASSLKLQTLSMIARFAAAWLIAVACLMTFARLVRAMAEAPSESSEAPLPAHTAARVP